MRITRTGDCDARLMTAMFSSASLRKPSTGDAPGPPISSSRTMSLPPPSRALRACSWNFTVLVGELWLCCVLGAGGRATDSAARSLVGSPSTSTMTASRSGRRAEVATTCFRSTALMSAAASSAPPGEVDAAARRGPPADGSAEDAVGVVSILSVRRAHNLSTDLSSLVYCCRRTNASSAMESSSESSSGRRSASRNSIRTSNTNSPIWSALTIKVLLRCVRQKTNK
mmetsp:Transcript_14030/g.34749  ORF Transcript_14030/g.34749 Transcript_14030/m.34749 type:complete len:227 (-) Transcript_14030:848-1528(-)